MCLKNTNNHTIIDEIIKNTKHIKLDTEEKKHLFRYEVVRILGYYNMLDPQARELTGLDEKQYMYIIKNYSALMNKYPTTKENALEVIELLKAGKIRATIQKNGCNICQQTVCTNLKVTIDDLCTNCKSLFVEGGVTDVNLV